MSEVHIASDFARPKQSSSNMMTIDI